MEYSNNNNYSWFPASVSNVKATAMNCYPNPATNNVVVEGLTSQVNHIVLFNLFGQAIKPTYTFDGDKCNINVSALPKRNILYICC